MPNRLINLHEKNCFQNKDKRIAIMSEVASTGDSLHASRKARNQQRRYHIAAELKWSADKQVQDFGRTHRTDQFAPPIYGLIFTELGGETRFSATIARRLGTLGALTKGDRRAEKAGNLDKYNLESREGKAVLNVVFTRVLNGEEIIGLENPRQTLIDMGLLKDGGERDEITPAERTNIPRFLNRLLSLEVERQNALFDYFYQTFLETIEHLKAKGKIDNGMEDLKASSVRMIEPPQVLYTDALTGAKTIYYQLEITVPTRPARFEEISLFDSVYFYENRSTGEFVAVRPTLSHTDPETGERYQMVSVSRPSGYNLQYTREDELNSRYKIVPKSRARAWWQAEQAKIPLTEQKTIHLLSGALLPIWKNLKKLQQNGLNIVRTTTDDGIRLVGVNIASETIKEIRRAFGIWQNAAGTAEEIIRVVKQENEIVELLGEVRVRRTRFQGLPVIEICPGSYDQIRELRETALINIVQNSRNRFFLPENEINALETLEKVLKLYPPTSLLKSASSGIHSQNTAISIFNHSPISLPDWLIEPPVQEIERILVKN